MEGVQQGSNGTESQTATIPVTITSSQFSQIAQQVTHESHQNEYLPFCIPAQAPHIIKKWTQLRLFNCCLVRGL